MFIIKFQKEKNKSDRLWAVRSLVIIMLYCYDQAMPYYLRMQRSLRISINCIKGVNIILNYSNTVISKRIINILINMSLQCHTK